MKNLLFILFGLILLFSCTPVEEVPESKTVYIQSDNSTTSDFYTFSKVAVADQVLFEDWVDVNHNNLTWINLDVYDKIGSDSESCIAVIRIESTDFAESPEPTEWIFGKIRKPVTLLEPYTFSVFYNVRIYEVVLWCDDAGQLEAYFDFGWPEAKSQKVKISILQYAKTK